VYTFTLIVHRRNGTYALLSQDGDSLMDVLQPYLHTGVNLTTFRFSYEGNSAADNTVADLTPTAADGRYNDDVFATVYDSLLTLYQGVRHQSRGSGGCQWAGDNLLSTLAKVCLSVWRSCFYRVGQIKRGHSFQ